MGNLVDRIIKGDLQAFDDLYMKYKLPVMSILSKSTGVKGDGLTDLFHSAALALFENCTSGRIKEGTLPDSNVRAYLIRTAKNIFLAGMRKKERYGKFMLPLDDPDYPENIEKQLPDQEQDPDFEKKIEQVRDAVWKMEAPCDELLMLRHFERRSSEEIASLKGYANGDVAKNMVSRCMKKLKAYVMGKFEELGI